MKLDQLKSVGLIKGDGSSEALTQRTVGSQTHNQKAFIITPGIHVGNLETTCSLTNAASALLPAKFREVVL